ncbi:MAG: helix-turn-helix domain-containing protein [Opitutales bacterium]
MAVPDMLESLPLGAGLADNQPANPNRIHRPRGLPVWLLEYTFAGAVAIRTSQRETVRLAAGACFLYPPDVRQAYVLAPDARRWKHAWVTFRARPDWQWLLRWPGADRGPGILRIEDLRRRRRIEALVTEIVEQTVFPFRYSAALAANLLEQLLLRLDVQNPLREADLPGDPRIRRALIFLHQRAAQALSVEGLAEVAHLSVSQFTRLFRRDTGLPPQQYLERYRIDQARERLRFTQDPIARIAEQVGYPNPIHFSTVFRRQTGMSPRAFRQAAQP